MPANYATQVPADRLCKLLDLGIRRLQQLADEGIIKKSDRGRYDLVESVRGYVKFLRDRTLGPDQAANTYAEQRARLTRARADEEELKARQLAGELIPAAQLENAWGAVVDVMRLRLLAIPAKVAARIGMARNAVEAQQIIRAEIHDALTELTKVNVTVAIDPTAAIPDDDASDDRADRGGDAAPAGPAA